MSEFLLFDRCDLEFDSPSGAWVIRNISRVLMRKSQIDRVDAAEKGTCIMQGNTSGKGPCWSMRVNCDFNRLMEKLTEDRSE